MYRYFLLLLFCSSTVLAQDLAYFTDKLQRFWAFDAGTFHKIYHLPVKNVQLGGNYLIYEDQLGQLMQYRNGKSEILDYLSLSPYYRVGRYYMAADVQGALRLYYDGKKEMITLTQGINEVFDYKLGESLGDSILAYIDFDRQLKAFYKGEKYALNNQIILQHRLENWQNPTLAKHKVSSNSVAYLTENETFSVFYNHKSQEIDTAYPFDYQVGNCGMVGYINRFNELWVFDGEKNQQLTSVKPQQWVMGSDMIAWINENNIFNCYYKGEAKELMPLAPKSFHLTDSLLTYIDERGFLNAYYQGKNHVLETFTPQTIYQKGGIAAYTDLNGRVKAFYEGEQVQVSNEVVSNFEIMGRCIVYYLNQYGNNSGDAHIFWNKKQYAP
jgi:hypothetical protein